MNPESIVTLVKPGDKMKICTFLWVYYGYPAATYEGVNVEEMRYNCGKLLAKRDNVDVDVNFIQWKYNVAMVVDLNINNKKVASYLV